MKQLEAHSREDRAWEELRVLGALREMYVKWKREDVQDTQDRLDGLDVPFATIDPLRVEIQDEMDVRFENAERVAQAGILYGEVVLCLIDLQRFVFEGIGSLGILRLRSL